MVLCCQNLVGNYERELIWPFQRLNTFSFNPTALVLGSTKGQEHDEKAMCVFLFQKALCPSFVLAFPIRIFFCLLSALPKCSFCMVCWTEQKGKKKKKWFTSLRTAQVSISVTCSDPYWTKSGVVSVIHPNANSRLCPHLGQHCKSLAKYRQRIFCFPSHKQWDSVWGGPLIAMCAIVVFARRSSSVLNGKEKLMHFNMSDGIKQEGEAV